LAFQIDELEAVKIVPARNSKRRWGN